jgi:tetraacyldisaccharide 4'-kinase
VLLKSLHPSVPIAVGVRKIDAARLLLANHRVDLLLADDAFQHRALYRDKDLVVLDATAAPSDYLDVPWGRAREGFSSLKRADYLVLSKWNRLQPPEQTLYLDWLRDQGAEELVPRSHWIYLNYTWRGFYDLRRRPRSFSKRPRVFAVSGLARPASFWNLVGEHSDVEEQHSYRDHHDYSAGDVEYLAERCRQRGFDAVVITEKDAVKIRDLVDPSRFDLFVVAGLLAEGDGPGWGGLRDDLAALAL